MDIDKKMKGHFNYKLVLRWIIIFAIFIFLGRMVRENWIQLKETHFAFRSLPLLLSTFIFAFSYFIQIWAWYLITVKLEIAISPSDTLGSWFYSQLGKYLPGKVWLLLSRYYFYESKGKSKKAISIALYLETLTAVMAAGLIFLATLAFFKEIRLYCSGKTFGWLLVPFILAFIAIHPRILQKIFNWALMKFKREPILLSISYSGILWILWVNIVAWVVGGIGFYLFVESVIPVSSSYILFLTGALAFSSTLGLIALFAPSGLGVREGALVYLLSFIVPVSVAVIVSILTRIWMTLIEIGLIGVVYLLDNIRKGSGKGSSDVKT